MLNLTTSASTITNILKRLQIYLELPNSNTATNNMQHVQLSTITNHNHSCAKETVKGMGTQGGITVQQIRRNKGKSKDEGVGNTGKEIVEKIH